MTTERFEPAASRKTSAYYMKRMRASLAEAGYVKHEAWVLPENRALFKNIEKRLRQPVRGGHFKLEEGMSAGEHWTIDSLYKALLALDEVATNEVAVSLVQGAEPSIRLEMNEYGGLPIFVAVVGEQIVVDTLLIEAAAITDVAAFNDAVLRSRELFPLSSVGLETMPNGQTVYFMFGALSAGSSLTNIVTEVYTLVDNVQRATEAFADFFQTA